jgi:hypothetical protein
LLVWIIINDTHNLIRAVAVLGQGLGDGAAGPAGTDDEGATLEQGLGQGQGVEATPGQEQDEDEKEKSEKGKTGGGQGRRQVRDEQVDGGGFEDGGRGGGEAAGGAQVVGVEGVGQGNSILCPLSSRSSCGGHSPHRRRL